MARAAGPRPGASALLETALTAQIILSIAAVISLALGLYQDLGTPPEFIECPDGPNNQCELPSVDWVEGLAIMVAIAIVVSASRPR